MAAAPSRWRRLLRWGAFLLLLPALGLAAAYVYLTHRTEGRFFDADGLRLHYTDEGVGPPVVLLHGFAVNADLNWRRPGLTAALARDFRVIALDLRGHGLSEKPHEAGRYGQQMVDDVVRLLDHLGLDEAQVVGYSLGGFIALKLAVTHPGRVRSIAPLGSGWEPPEHPTFQAALHEFASALARGESVGPLAAGLGGKREPPGVLHRLWVNLLTGYLNDPQALVAMIRGLPELAVTEAELRALELPVCSIAGDRDPLRASLDSMRGLLRDHTVRVIEDADHLTATMRPELLETLRSFLVTNASKGAHE